MRPRFWPGSFTKSGMNAMSTRFRGVTFRRGSPGRKLTPWSAVTIDERAIVEPRRAQAVEEQPERMVRVAELEEDSAARACVVSQSSLPNVPFGAPGTTRTSPP